MNSRTNSQVESSRFIYIARFHTEAIQSVVQSDKTVKIKLEQKQTDN